MSFQPIVYLIDDDKVNCFLVKNIMADAYPACEVTCFNTVWEALQALKKVKNDLVNFPALILLDLYMPEEDGWDFLETYSTLQNSSFTKCDVLILTCSQYPKDIEKAKRYKCVTDYLVKPITEESVTHKLDNVFYSKKYI